MSEPAKLVQLPVADVRDVPSLKRSLNEDTFQKLNIYSLTGVDCHVYLSNHHDMTKQEAADLFGGKDADLARALDMTRGGISQWPDELTTTQRDRVLGAAMRLGRPIPARLRQSQAA